LTSSSGGGYSSGTDSINEGLVENQGTGEAYR
jgi:hypothetical protein